MKRFLITTALEDTWRFDQPVLFLGEWCRRYTAREKWKEMDAELLPYHWDDREKLFRDYRYAAKVYEGLLLDLTFELNRLHNVEHDSRYWRIVIGPWLGSFVQVLLDRWLSIQSAVQMYELSGTIVLESAKPAVAPNDISEFNALCIKDSWNHRIYAAMLEDSTAIARILVNDSHELDSTQESRNSSVLRKQSVVRKARRKLARLYARIASMLVRDSDALLLNTYMQGSDQLKLQARLGQVPQIREPHTLERFPVDTAKRTWSIKSEASSGFEQFVRRVIPDHIPAAYIEGYRQLVVEQPDLDWPKHPRVIFTSNSYSSDEIFKIWAAEKVEAGSRLVIGQHGGHYGIGKWSFYEDHEIAISDRYLTWGWTTPGEPKVTPVGRIKAGPRSGIRLGEEPRLLLVTCALPRYSYWMYSVFVAGQYLGYFDDQCAFIAALPDSISKQLTVRLFPQDFGWDQQERWRDRMPRVPLDDGSVPIGEAICQSRICVCTYNATTFLESLSMNVPTVIFWNPEHWEIKASAIPFFKELQRAGIFHESPESAARQVAKVWDDVDSWWHSMEVVTAVERFKVNYCDSGPGLVNRVAQALAGAAKFQNQIKSTE
ncbi:MAG: transferase [Gemmatimonadaceae bacterium]|nr:transferase [Gemmatimonadaceae bacterium]